jgi:nicotinamidase-related amidase
VSEDRELPERTALLVVDVQRGYVNEETQATAEAIGRLLDRAGGRFALRVASRFVNTADAPTRRLLDSDSCSRPPDTDLFPPIQRDGVEVLSKNTYALGAPLTRLLEDAGAEALVIVGVDTHACVLHEALDAFDRGIRPVVPADLCASGDGPEAHDQALEILRRAIGTHNVWPTLDGVV